MTIWLLIFAYVAGLFTPPIVSLSYGFISGAIWQWEKLKRRR